MPRDHWVRAVNEYSQWALVCGAVPYSPGAAGLVCVDADDPEAVAWCDANLPVTPLVEDTSGGGRHYFYRHPGERIGNRQGVGAMRLDVRGDGGIVRLRDAAQFWTPELIAEAPPFDPTWLPARQPKPATPAAGGPMAVEDMEERERQAERYLEAVPGSVSGKGVASKDCFRHAVVLVHGFALDEEAAVRRLSAWGEKGVDGDGSAYPWEEPEIRHKVQDAFGARYDGTPGDRLRRPKRHLVLDHEAIAADCQADMPETPPAPARKGRFRLLRLSDLLSMPPPEWLVSRHVTTGAFGNVFAPSGTGKSFFTLEMALCVATGRPFLGKFDVRRGPVVYVCGEGLLGMRKRCAAWMQATTLDPSDNFVFLGDPLNLCDKDAAGELAKEARQLLGAPPALAVVDTLGRNFGGGDPNSLKDMQAFCDGCQVLQADGAAVVVVHHTGHAVKTRERSASNLRDNCDFAICLGEGGVVSQEKQKDHEPHPDYVLRQVPVTLDNPLSLAETDSIVLEWGGPAAAVNGKAAESAADAKAAEFLSHLEAGPLTQAEIEAAAGVSHATASKWLARYTAAGWIAHDGARPKRFSLADSGRLKIKMAVDPSV